MKIKIQIKSIYGGVLFEFEKENNTQRETILEAIKQNANLSSADLSYADLSYADLSYANLSSANLRSANLRSANLSSANLSSADLSYADLSYANLSSADLSSAHLRSANLRSANLSYANLSYANLRSADLSYANLSSADLIDTFIGPTSKWCVGMKNDLIKIGCKEKSIEDWDIWFAGTEEYSTKRGTKEFAMIQAHYESVKAYVLFMKNFKSEYL